MARMGTGPSTATIATMDGSCRFDQKLPCRPPDAHRAIRTTGNTPRPGRVADKRSTTSTDGACFPSQFPSAPFVVTHNRGFRRDVRVFPKPFRPFGGKHSDFVFVRKTNKVYYEYF